MFCMNKHESWSYESDHQKKEKINCEGEVGKACEACCCGPDNFLCMISMTAGDWIKRVSVDQ